MSQIKDLKHTRPYLFYSVKLALESTQTLIQQFMHDDTNLSCFFHCLYVGLGLLTVEEFSLTWIVSGGGSQFAPI